MKVIVPLVFKSIEANIKKYGDDLKCVKKK